MERHFCEILAEYISRGGLAKPNPTEGVRDAYKPTSHDIPIRRLGERHTSGGSSAECMERSYQGEQVSDLVFDASALDEDGFLRQEAIERVEHQFEFRTNQ